MRNSKNAKGDFSQAFDDMGLTLNIADLGAMVNIVSTIGARTNASGQSVLGDLADKLSGQGILELHLNSSGATMNFGTGGTNIAGDLYELTKRGIDHAMLAEYAKENGSEKGNAAYWSYVYGNRTQENTAARIASAKDILELAKDGVFTAKTVQNASGNGRIITMKDSGDDFQNAIQLGHEAYRDGLVMNNQKDETLQAVLAHSSMAAEMAGDGIELNGLTAIEAALYNAGRTDLLAGLASVMYDSTADYWKLMSDGSLVQDKDGWLRDENNNFIMDKDGNKIGAYGQETGLLNILFSKQTDGSYKNPGKAYNDFNLLEKIISSEIMEKSGISYCYEDEGKSGIYNRMWNKDAKTLNMNLVMGYAGDSIATAVFARYYDSTVDALYAKSHKLDADIANTQQVTNAASNRFNTLYDVKSSFYDSIGAFFESENTKITGDYGKEIQDPTKNPKDYYKNYNNLHYGIDIIRWSGSDDLYLGISGKILQNDWNSAEGWTVQSNYGYNFEDSYISTGIYGEYGHLAKKSDLQVNKYYNANDKVGLFGNTGNKSTGAHLHYSIYTQNSYYSDSTMRILLGKNYQMGSMYNGSWRTVYDPTKLYERYKK